LARPAIIVRVEEREYAGRTEACVSDDEVIVLRKYVSEVEATMAHLVLEAHNIPSAVMRDTAGGMIPSMALLYPVRLAVRREDADEARRILDSEAPLPSEDGGEEPVDEPHDFSGKWSPEHDDDGPDEDPDEDSESDRRW
jgi:hypothetical protein